MMIVGLSDTAIWPSGKVGSKPRAKRHASVSVQKLGPLLPFLSVRGRCDSAIVPRVQVGTMKRAQCNFAVFRGHRCPLLPTLS
jgi:hypothetical protein